MFVFQRQQDAAQPLSLPGATLEPMPIDAGSAKFDLTLFAQERTDRIDTMIEFRRDLFDSSTVESLLRHYGRLLESIATGFDEPIQNLALLTGEEEASLLRDWQGPKLSVEQEPLLVEAISSRMAAQPAIFAAITGEGETMTYGELHNRADAVAHQLLSMGVERGEAVALHMERSPAAIAGIVGILQAGAAYLPIDPDYPAERRRFLLRDAGVRRVVTDSGAGDDFESMDLATVAVPDGRQEPPTGSPDRPVVGPEDLAYVIYTSGSTGVPKGVLVNHGNLRASNAARLETYPAPPARYLLIPSLSFDSSVAGLFWTLSTGGTLVLPTSREVRDTEALSTTIERQRVTHLLCIPSLYRGLLEAGETARLHSLETVIVAGEVCSSDLVARHREMLPEVPMFNEYGPTEATVWATVHRCEASDSPGPVPIGRPIANIQVFVLDSQRRLVPPRIPGEIAIGGSSVAQGYLERPDLTGERFIDLEVPGASTPTRVYKTGDLGRWRPDGVLDFLGRRDEQVKLSGFRIELAEIETALQAHPAIGEAAAVMVAGSEPSEPGRLAAYYVPIESDSESIPVASIRSFLADKLPRHLIPTTLSQVGALPRLPNGKLDRQTLVERPSEGCSLSSTEVVPNRFEIQLMRIWLELLDDPSIDRQSNFFEHGGHSLLIPGLIERVRQDFDVELPLGAIFEAPTVAELAAVIETDEGRDSWRSLVKIRSGGSRAPLYVIHGLAGEISYFYNLARYLPRDRRVYGVQAPATPFDEMVPMATAYLEEIRLAQPHGPYLLVGYCLGGCIAYEMARQLLEAGEQVATLVLINSVPPSHLLGESAPLATILARRLKRFASKGPRQMLASITSTEAVRRHLKSGVRGDKETTDETLEELLERMHPAYQEATMSHYRALRDYYPQPYPGDAWLFRGSDLYLGADYAWRQIVQGQLEVESITGHHQYVLKEPNVQGAAEKLTQILASLDS
jgi:amino acid adenylation domain-containing protein